MCATTVFVPVEGVFGAMDNGDPSGVIPRDGVLAGAVVVVLVVVV